MVNALDDFNDIFFEDEDESTAAGGNDSGGGRKKDVIMKNGGGNDDRRKKKNANNNNDDAISIGSSSSSDDDDSSTSSSSDGSVVSIPAKKQQRNNHCRQKMMKKKATEEEDESDSDITIPLKQHNDNNNSKGDKVNNSITSKALDDIGSKQNNDKEEEDLDADLDDDDLVEFFSHSPMPPDSKKNVQKKDDVDYGFDTLDDDDLAELEENDFDTTNNEGVSSNKSKNGSTKEEDDTHSVTTTSNKRDFTISYNCEKKECPMEEALVESSDDEDGEQVRSGHRRKNKENSSPNKKSKMKSSYFGNNNLNSGSNNNEQGEDGSNNDEILDLFVNDDNDTKASPRKASPPDSPSSLDTPREQPTSPSASFKDDGEEEEELHLSKPTTNNPYQSNPYQKKPQENIQSKHRRNNANMNVENQRTSPSNGTSNLNPSTFTNQDVRSEGVVVALPDIGLSPNAQQSEIEQLGITNSHFKPPPYTPSPDPIVHKLNSSNRPQHARRTIAVDQVFHGPVKNLWKSSKFNSFNHVQSEMVNVLANSDDNVIVSAPTGAGKTALFEMAMARLFTSNLQHEMGIGGVSKARKVVYVAPNKALCEERQVDWSKRLTDIDPGIVCTTITGDVNSTSSYNEIAMAHLILTTPEKWDSITRKWNDQFVLLSSIKLVLIDEVHMIGETDRGGTLESVISRMKTIQRAACSKTLSVAEIASSR